MKTENPSETEEKVVENTEESNKTDEEDVENNDDPNNEEPKTESTSKTSDEIKKKKLRILSSDEKARLLFIRNHFQTSWI